MLASGEQGAGAVRSLLMLLLTPFRPCRPHRAHFLRQLVEHAIDVFVASIPPMIGQLDTFVNDDAHRHIGRSAVHTRRSAGCCARRATVREFAAMKRRWVPSRSSSFSTP